MQRNTKQRQILLEELRKVRTHPDASEIYIAVRKRLPNVSLGTVYRNLDAMSKERKIMKINCGNFSRFDGFAESHSHFICENCSRIFDIEYGTEGREKRFKLECKFDKRALEKKTGNEIFGSCIELHGICKDCKEKAQKK